LRCTAVSHDGRRRSAEAAPARSSCAPTARVSRCSSSLDILNARTGQWFVAVATGNRQRNGFLSGALVCTDRALMNTIDYSGVYDGLDAYGSCLLAVLHTYVIGLMTPGWRKRFFEYQCASLWGCHATHFQRSTLAVGAANTDDRRAGLGISCPHRSQNPVVAKCKNASFGNVRLCKVQAAPAWRRPLPRGA
jgi:hypothetical protein